LVTAADRVLLQRSLFINYPFTPELTLPSVVKHLNVGLTVNESGVASTSRGLVGDTVFAVIPNIKPVHTFIITIIFQMVGKITQLAGLSDIGSGLSYQAMESADL
jgi:alpha-1,3-glucosyltransferase